MPRRPEQTDPGAGGGVLLVGTGSTLGPLRAAFAAGATGERVAGEAQIGPGASPAPAEAFASSGADRAVVCLPAALGARAAAISAELEAAGVPTLRVAPLAEQLRAGAAGAAPRGVHAPLDLAALIDRRPRPLDAGLLGPLLTGRRVLVTGAGGSIGSELCRVIAGFGPAALVAVERSENALFEVERELRRRWPGVPVEAVLHDVTQAERTRDLFLRVRPEVAAHAAAHKHVGMMEGHPAEAIENNLYGTRSVAAAADACGADRLVMISTDKAVNPSSVMGASKRLAEREVTAWSRRGRTRMCCVRFGNVLGSACSVLPIWEAQLARGGPLEVTDPRMRRYFMTIPEAAGLVLTAAALSGGGSDPVAGGETFLLDMGRPVRIVDLAERFLRQKGLEPGVDVAVRFTGARPGEKLFEELSHPRDRVVPTAHPGVRVWRTAPVPAEAERAAAALDGLRRRAGLAAPPWRGVSPAEAAAALRAAVPEMLGPGAGVPAALAG